MNFKKQNQVHIIINKVTRLEFISLVISHPLIYFHHFIVRAQLTQKGLCAHSNSNFGPSEPGNIIFIIKCALY